MPAKTHGMSGGGRQTKRAKIYGVWSNIKQRCYNKNNPRYKDYGGRGIHMHPPWRDSFAEFYAYVGDPPNGRSLDRKDNGVGYVPGNVQWADKFQQARNSRRATQVTIGDVTLVIAEWLRLYKIPYATFKQRRRRGWEIERACSTPSRALAPRKATA